MTGTRRKALVVDDDFDNRALLSDALEASGFRVVLAVDGAEAIAAALRETPDIVFLDWGMPKLDGLAVVRLIRGTPRLSRVPVFAVTAFAMDGDEERVMAAGCDGYFSKPYDPRRLVKTARERLERGGGGG